MRPILVAWLAQALGPVWAELLTPDYMSMLSMAFVLSGALTLRIGLRHGLDMRRGLLALAAVYAGGLAGARVFTGLVHVPQAILSGDPSLLLDGGLTAYGGFLGGALGGYLGMRGRGFLALADAAAPALGLGTAVTRLGCLLGGCDFGAVSAAPWAVRYPAGSLAYRAHRDAGWVGPYALDSLAVHPSPLYEALLGLCLCALALAWLQRRRGRALDGRVFVTVAGVYALVRFLLELLRGDEDRGLFALGPARLSTSQLTSLLVLAAACAWFWKRRRGEAGTPGPQPAPQAVAPQAA